MAEFKVQESSVGGDAADLFGNLERIETGTPYNDSLNPNGDPYVGFQNTQEIINAFASSHPNSLEILDQRLDSFYGIDKDPNKEKPQVYTEAKTQIKEILTQKNTVILTPVVNMTS